LYALQYIDPVYSAVMTVEVEMLKLVKQKKSICVSVYPLIRVTRTCVSWGLIHTYKGRNK
jgi:hypothetical protein